MSTLYTEWPMYSNGDLMQVGDWIKTFVQRLGVWHHGVVRDIRYNGAGLEVIVAHNMKESGVTLSHWDEFADNGVIVLERHPITEFHAACIVERVDANIGAPYHLFAQNCEHFASFAYFGKAESKTVEFFVSAAVLTGCAALAVNMWNRS